LSPSSRRATPPICSDLICDRDRGRSLVRRANWRT
jgi:hypothetical protein